MSWISPSFCGDDAFVPPPKKKVKETSLKSETSQFGSQGASSNWFEKYKPKYVGDLLVNVKKIKEIEDWLKQAINENGAEKVLLLTGPSGSGKTTTLQCVCKSLGITVLEWITPLDRPAEGFDEFPSKFEYMKSATKQFEEYIFKTSRYNSLVTTGLKKLILVKDVPNIFIRNPASFHEVLERLSQVCINPIVFICSDESLCKKLFPSSLKDSLKLYTVTFNPITDQKMIKFLKSLLSQESKVDKNIKMLPDEAICTICAASQGDVRGALSKLYFCSISSDFDISQLKPRGKTKKQTKSDTSVDTDKDKRLDFFHGIGRVLYPKKVETEKGIKFVHSTTEIVENFMSEPKSFINQLHENYPTKMGSVQDLRDAAERFSKSDIIMSRWQEKDIFYEYALSLAIQGVMVANKHPQKSKFEAFKRSQTSRLEVDTRALELEGKALFSDLHILEYVRLIDILPYARTLLRFQNQGQLDYISRTCHFR